MQVTSALTLIIIEGSEFDSCTFFTLKVLNNDFQNDDPTWTCSIILGKIIFRIEALKFESRVQLPLRIFYQPKNDLIESS